MAGMTHASDVSESFLSSQSHKPLSQSRIVGLQGQVNVKSNEISRFSYVFFCYEIAPCKLVNGAPYATKWRR